MSKNKINYTYDKNEEIKGELVYLPVDNLFPHPDNPRKDLGDLTELAESIKVKGVMQNLTVVPKDENTYTVIIGHRRTAAAKLAGLTELPCVIVDMDPQEQIGTMLLENMQRSDLTVYEQAKGFQLMLDFGDTVETVAEKSGFSQSTVRRRIKLLELDEEKFKKSEARNVSLLDYMELEKIKDNELKNKLLDSIGTANFNNELKKAIEQEETKEYFDNVEAEVSKFAVKIEDRAGYAYVTNYGTWNEKSVVVPDDADTVQYYYKRDDRYITVYKEKEEIPVDEEAERIKAEKEADEERRKEELKESTARAFELRRDAINCISNSHAQKHITEIIIFIMKIIKEFYVRVYDSDVFEILGIDIESDEYEGWDDEKIDTYILNLIETRTKEESAKILLKFAYAISEDTAQCRYYDTWDAKYMQNKRLDMIYDFLCSLGYEMSDEEKALRDGTHELFKTENGAEQ